MYASLQQQHATKSREEGAGKREHQSPEGDEPNKTVIVMLFTLHVLHRLCADKCSIQNHVLGLLKKIASLSLCHTHCSH